MDILETLNEAGVDEEQLKEALAIFNSQLNTNERS